MFTSYWKRNSDCQVAAMGRDVYPKYSPAGAPPRARRMLRQHSRLRELKTHPPAPPALPSLREKEELKTHQTARSQIGDSMRERLTRAARDARHGSEEAQQSPRGRTGAWRARRADGALARRVPAGSSALLAQPQPACEPRAVPHPPLCHPARPQTSIPGTPPAERAGALIADGIYFSQL